MKANANILSVIEIWGWDGKGGDFNMPLALDIRITGNKRLFLSLIRSKNLDSKINNTPLKSPFTINLVGENAFSCYSEFYSAAGERKVVGRNEKSYGIPVDLISQELGIRLNTVREVVSNYDKINAFVSEFIKPESESKYSKSIIFTNTKEREKGIERLWLIDRFTRFDAPDFFRSFYEGSSPFEDRIIHTR
jgi:hypothetical protein